VGRTLERALPPPGVWRPAAQEEEDPASAECDVRGIVESPTEGATVAAGPLTITGWAADIVATDGTGIDQVRVSLDADPDQGGVPVSANYGMERPDIAELLGDPRFTGTGFALAWDSTSTTPGPHVLYVQVHGTCGWTGTSRSVVVGGGATAAAPAAVATTPATTPTRAATTPSPAATSSTLVFPTVPLVTATSTVGSLAASAAGTTTMPGAPTVPLTTATIAPSPTGSIPGPTNVTASINPMDGSINLNWTAPAAMVTAYLVVVNEADGSQRPVRDVPGSSTRAVLTGLDPRIGYSLSVVPIDSMGRRGSASPAVSTAGAMTATPIPSPTLSPYCTPVPFGPPMCPPPGFNPAACPGGVCPGGTYPGGMYPGAGCPPTGPYGAGAPYGAPGPYGMPGQYGPGNPYGAPMPYGYPPGAVPGQGCYGQPYGVGVVGGIGGTFTLTATLVNGNTAQLTWGAIPNASSYNVLQGINGQPPTQNVQSAGLATTASIPVAPGQQYQFQIQAMGPTGVEVGRSMPTTLTGTGVGYPVGVPGVGGCGAPGQACASRSTAIPSPPSAPFATGLQINVTVLDMNGQPVIGAPVNITPSSGNATAQTPFATSGPGGIATFFVRGNGPGPATFTVTVNSQPLPVPVSVSFT
jgi:hypothetical protein